MSLTNISTLCHVELNNCVLVNVLEIATKITFRCVVCQNYTEQYKGAAAHTVTTRLQYTKVRAGERW